MRILRLLSAVVFVALTMSCGKNKVDEGTLSVTGGAEDVYCFGATLCGYAYLTNDMSEKTVKYGIDVSDDKVALEGGKASESIKGSDRFGDGLYKVKTVVQHNRTYYYRSWLSFQEKVYYGEIRQFTTPDISLKVFTDDVEISGKTVVFNGHITFEGLEPGGLYWFQYGTSADNLDKKTPPFDKGTGPLTFSYTHDNNLYTWLESGKTYYYKAKVSLTSPDGTTREGEVKSFTMP